MLGRQYVDVYLQYTEIAAGIAQLGEQQTEVLKSRVLEAACSSHAPGIFLSLFSAAKGLFKQSTNINIRTLCLNQG
jgi:hypothetical protein